MIEKEKIIDNNKILELKIERGENGIKLYCRSWVVEEFFKQIGHNEILTSNSYRTEDGKQKEFYRLHEVDTLTKILRNFNSIILDYYGYSLNYGDKYNISFLRTKGISDGITILLSNIYSTDFLRDFAKKVKEFVAFLYKYYFRKLRITVTMTEEAVI